MSALFIAASFSTNQCELYRNESGSVEVFVPTRDSHEAKMELGDITYTKAEVVARQMGLEPKWSV